MSPAMKKVIVATNSWYGPRITLIRDMGFEEKMLPDRVDDSFRKEMATAHALIPGLLMVDRKILEEAPHLVIVAAHGVGYNNVDLHTADELGVLVTNSPGVNSDAVAEFTFGLMLSLARKIPQGDQEMKRGGWRRPELWGGELREKTLSIIGLGRIGSRVARIGTAFGMEVLACDPYLREENFREAGARPVSPEEAVVQADFLTLHAPLTEETRGMIGAGELARMKKGAFLINTARGGIADEEALVKALDQGIIAGAGIDVFEEEPPADRRLAAHGRVLTSPHMAGLSDEARYRMSQGAAERVACALRGQTPPDVVNRPTHPRYLRKE